MILHEVITYGGHMRNITGDGSIESRTRKPNTRSRTEPGTILGMLNIEALNRTPICPIICSFHVLFHYPCKNAIMTSINNPSVNPTTPCHDPQTLNPKSLTPNTKSQRRVMGDSLQATCSQRPEADKGRATMQPHILGTLNPNKA